MKTEQSKQENDYTALLKPVGTKQETLEEAFKKTYLGQRLFFDSNEGKSFEEGAKWQQEQDKNKYSEEDLRKAFLDGQAY